MGLTTTVTSKKVRSMYSETVNMMTSEIADKIIELNGGKSVNAVFVVGGGGKVHGFTDSLAKHLGIPKERVALRGEEVLGDVDFMDENIKKDPLLVTPIGICVNFYNQKNNFIFVNINDERIKLYDNDKLTVVDAAVQINFPNEELFPRRGASVNYTLNGIEKMIKGTMGEPAVITINGKEANINSKISKNDKIVIKASTVGEKAHFAVEQLQGYKDILKFSVNGNTISCPKFVNVNGELVSGSYEINDGDNIEILDCYTVEQIMTFMDIDINNSIVKINNHIAVPNEPVYENFSITIQDAPKPENTPEEDISEENISEENVTKDDYNIIETIAEDTKSEVNDNGIFIIVNKTPINLKGKSSYIFVDILDYYPFDTQSPKGTDVVMTINGEKAGFVDEIKDGDIIELYWK